MVTRGDDNDGGWWWLSFADPGASKGEQFLGVCIVKAGDFIVKAGDFIAAVRRTHELGINPGGQVRGHVLSEDRQPPEMLREKLVCDRAELERIARQWTGEGIARWENKC